MECDSHGKVDELIRRVANADMIIDAGMAATGVYHDETMSM
jgi:hypothetical protein